MQHGTEIGPTSVQHRVKIDPKSSKMGPWRPLGDPRAPRADFGTLQGRFWERRRSILEAMLVPKIDKIDVEIDSKNEHPFGITCGALRRPPGVDFGSILHRFWRHFWKLLAKRRICENRAAARAGARFSRFQGVQNALKNHQKRGCNTKCVPRPSWDPVEVDFRTMLAPCWIRKPTKNGT